MSSSVFKAQYILANVRVRFLMSTRGQPPLLQPVAATEDDFSFFPHAERLRKYLNIPRVCCTCSPACTAVSTSAPDCKSDPESVKT